MKALKAKPPAAEPPVEEMARLHGLGFSLLPLGGPDGKRPLVKFAGSPKMPLRRVLGPMFGGGSACYGIRLDGLLVLDCDEDDPALIEQLEARFGASPVHVATPRGRHLYYRSDGHRPNLKAEGLPVDVKSGPSAYVVGPQSTRPDGGIYQPVKGVLGKTTLPTLKAPASRPASLLAQPVARVPEGQRNKALTQTAIELVVSVESLEELLGLLLVHRERSLECPETVTDEEVEGVAKWAWEKRLQNQIFASRDSSFRVNRKALDMLRKEPSASDSIALYVLIVDHHGHNPAKPFALHHRGMKTAGLTDLSERRFRKAKASLIAAGLLMLHDRARKGTRHQTYRLRMPHAEALLESLKGRKNPEGGV